jgi:hypothetical protein
MKRDLLFALIATVALSTAFPLNSFATEDHPIPMLFQADKNNVQILPQRFEYSLINESQIKIGDILIDSSTFGFQIAPSATHSTGFRARFVWPVGLVKTGQLLIKNNTGKSIWSAPIRTAEIKLLKVPEKTDPPAAPGTTLRSQLAEVTFDGLPSGVVEDMKYLPFVSFCVMKLDEDTRINLCSRELYVGTVKGHPSIRSRSRGKKTPFVEINGRAVSNQGLIFLNDPTQNIGFRAMTESGATLEIETRMQPVDFKDVVQGEDKKVFLLTAYGAEPVTEDKVERISPNEWRATVSAERPVLYLKGAGEIPMRQEFYVKGELPSEHLRPHLSEKTFAHTLQPRTQLSGTSAPGASVTAAMKDDQVETSGDSFQWTIENIPAGQTSRHFVKVAPMFIAGFDIHREFAWEAELGAKAWLPAAQFVGDGAVTWWAEDFLGSTDDWAHMHWGVRIHQASVLNQKTDQANISATDFELLWRATPGFHFVDTSWGLSLPVELLQSTPVNGTAFGVGAFYNEKSPALLGKWFDWLEYRLAYLLATSGDPKLSSAIKAEALAYHHFDVRWSAQLGLGFINYAFDPGPSKPQVQLKTAAVYRF